MQEILWWIWYLYADEPAYLKALVCNSAQIMLDKPMTVKADKIGATFGHLDDASMVSVNRSLALVLGLAG
jgi:mRNA interferase MazF